MFHHCHCRSSLCEFFTGRQAIADRPEGLLGITNNMRVKVLQGNAFSGWLAELIAQCLDLKMVVMVENPHLSYLWWMPEWKKLASRSGCGFYVTDYCRWLMRWRKRTKFFGNFSLVGSSCLCRCSGPHIQLKGYSVLHKMSWTRVAEPYPRSLCRHLAASISKTLDAKMFDRSLEFQQNFPQQRQDLVTAWELLSRWEQVQPVTHRVPVPKLILDAVLAVSISWGWLRFAALTALAFHGAMRVGQPIVATREDLILPDEAALLQKFRFLRVSKPKPGRRGRGRVQHARVDDAGAVDLAVAAFSHLDPSEKLFAATASTYRRRWDRAAEALQIPASLEITPGGLRGGGAVFMYHRNLTVADILWRMRLKQQSTLESYLQETATITIIHQLPQKSLVSIKSAAAMLPFMMRPFSS